MASLMDTLLKGLGASDTVKDYAHASRIFVSEQFLRSPKYGFMFYVVFHYDNGGFASGPTGLNTPTSKGNQLGALCKSAALPKYTIDNVVMNAYNRADIVQKKIKYDPVTLKFHDDSADTVREFWYDYMTYYYRDSEYQPAVYGMNHKYQTRTKDGWGFGLRPLEDTFDPLYGQFGGMNIVNYHPLKAISIYSFTQGRFSEYQLMNPIITSFRHGEHNSEGSTLMEHEMTVSYEAVKYYKGYVGADETLADTMLLLYDNTPSALSAGSTRSIFGPGGFVNTIDSALADLSEGNWAGAFLKINRATQTFKGTNFGDLLRTEGIETINQAIRNGTNPLSTVNAPNIGDVTNNIAGGIRNTNPYYLAAAGGLAAYGAVQVLGDGNSSSNRVGSESTVATSRPSTIAYDNTSATTDYRATSGDIVVTTAYQAPVRTPSFPQLTPASSVATSTGSGVRELANYSVEELSQEIAARQQVNLNTSQNIISGASQGTTPLQPRPPSPNSRVLSTNFVIKYQALQNEIDEFVVASAEDAARLTYLKDKMANLLAGPLFTAAVADDPDLLNARQSYIYELRNGTPPIGAARETLGFGYVTLNEYTNARGRLNTRILSKADAPQSSAINKFDTLRANIVTAGQAGNYDQVIDLIKQFLSFSKEPLVVQAFDGIIDSEAFANAYGDWFTKFAVGQTEPVPDIKNFWVQS